MAINFREASIRHHDDGESLFQSGSYDNADHLFGFAAECALKRCLPKKHLLADGDVTRQFKCHIYSLWNQMLISNIQKSYPTILTLLKSRRPFDNWHESYRYHHTGYVDLNACQAHRQETKRIMGAAGITRRGASPL